MKKRQISTGAVNYIIGALLVLFVAFVWMMLQVRTGGDHESSVYNLNKLAPIDPVVSDSLPHYKYKSLKRNIEYSRKMKNGMFTGGSSEAWFTGFTTHKRCDTCSVLATSRNSEDEKDYAKDYLIKLTWWQLDTGTYTTPVVYYVKSGQSFLRKTTCTLISTHQKQSNYDCYEADVPVSFRYDKKEKGIMIPVSKMTYDIFKPFFMVMIWGATLAVFYFMLSASLKVFVDIRNGDPFSKGNVSRLKWLTIFCFSTPAVLFLLNLMMWAIFYRHFTTDVKLSSEAWLIFWKPFVLGLIFAALYSAFKRGKQLKEEQDLTI